MSKPAMGWAIQHWRGHLYVETVRRTRREAISAFIEQFDHAYDNAANKAVRVVILAMLQAKDGK